MKACSVVTRKAATNFINWRLDGLSLDDAKKVVQAMQEGASFEDATAGMQRTYIATMSDGTTQIQIEG